MRREVGVQIHSVACACLVAPASSIEKAVLSPLNGLHTLVGNQFLTRILYCYFLESIT